MVFSEKADRSWVEQAKVVVAEPHDRFHTFFNLGPQVWTSRMVELAGLASARVEPAPLLPLMAAPLNRPAPL